MSVQSNTSHKNRNATHKNRSPTNKGHARTFDIPLKEVIHTPQQPAQKVEGDQKPNTSSPQLKRYNLVLPQDLHDQIESIAAANATTVAQVIRQYLKLGLVAQAADSKGGAVYIDDGETTTRIVVL